MLAGPPDPKRAHRRDRSSVRIPARLRSRQIHLICAHQLLGALGPLAAPNRRLARVHRLTDGDGVVPVYVQGCRGTVLGGEPFTGRPRRCTRRRCTWRAGPARSEGCRISWWCAGRRGRRLPARRGTGPGVECGSDECVPERVGPTGLVIPARRAIRRTIRPAPCRSSRRPSAARKMGPSLRSPIARSIARAVRGASGIVTTSPPLRVITKVRCPRSMPSASMPALVASDTRSPLRASREISACSAGGPSPAATSSAPSSLRSRAVAWDS